MTIKRRKELLTLLKESSSAINGQQLADHFHVTRQIIVQDIAILRADGEEIISTNRGYIYSGSKESKQMQRLFKVKHSVNDIEEELAAIIDNGGRVKTVLVDHPVYGEIQTLLKMTCRRDIYDFMKQVEETEFRPLSEITDGVHYHLVEADTKQDLDEVEKALRKLGFLIDDSKKVSYRLSVIVVYDASKPSVSWLKIELRVSIFLVIKSARQFLSLVLLFVFVYI